MNDLMLEQTQTMTTREIADLTGKEHFHVLRDFKLMAQELGLEFDGYIQNWIHPQNGQTYTCCALPKDLVLTLVSGYSVVMRKRIIDRWLELEQQNAPRNIPATFAEALRLAADQAEQLQIKTQQLEAAKPAIEFVDRFVDATGLKSFREVCKVLGAKEPEFRDFLQRTKVMYLLNGSWTPYSEHIDAGRFVVKVGEAGNGHAFNSAKFTPKGVHWIAGKWAIYNIKEKARHGDE